MFCESSKITWWSWQGMFENWTKFSCYLLFSWSCLLSNNMVCTWHETEIKFNLTAFNCLFHTPCLTKSSWSTICCHSWLSFSWWVYVLFQDGVKLLFRYSIAILANTMLLPVTCLNVQTKWYTWPLYWVSSFCWSGLLPHHYNNKGLLMFTRYLINIQSTSRWKASMKTVLWLLI